MNLVATTPAQQLAERLDQPAFRTQFPSLEHTIHLANCSFAPPSAALTQVQAQLSARLATGAPPWHDHEDELVRSRELFAALVGAAADQIAVLPNASIAAFQAASTVDWAERRNIVAAGTEFPSLGQVWHRLAREVRLVGAAPDGHTSVDDVVAAIDEGTGLVSVPLAAYRTGALASVEDLTRVAEHAHRVGAVLLVDAYQAIGVVPFDVTELSVDFVVGGAMKYLLGQPGVAYLYASRPERGRQPALTGWFGRPNPFSFDPADDAFPPQARRFETGTPPFPLVIAANSGLDLLARVDAGQVWPYVSELVADAADQLSGAGHRVVSPVTDGRRGPMVTLGLSSPAEANALGERLEVAGIVASPRGDAVRLAFHYFNTHDDVVAIRSAIEG